MSSELKDQRLRKHYNVEAQPPREKIKEDPESVDSKQFKADRAFKKLLQSQGIDGLLQKDNELRTEIKNLDGRMKTLVHNNYKKFIIAAETINKMNANIEAMETQMLHLQNSTEKIEKNSQIVSEHLTPKRSEVEQLSGVHQLLRQLLFLAQVPAHLETALTTGNYADGIEYYNKTSSILDKYSATPSFEIIKLKSDQLLGDVKKAVMDKFDDLEIPVQQTQKYCLLLRAMNEIVGNLRVRFCQKRSEMLYRLLEKWKKFPIHPTSPNEPKSETYKQIVTRISEEFFPVFINFINSYKYLFFSHGEDDYAADDLEGYINLIFKEYVQTVSHCLIQSDISEIMKECLKLVGNLVMTGLKEYPLIRPNLGNHSKIIVCNITNHIVNHYFELLVHEYNTLVTQLGPQLQLEEAKSEPPNSYYQDLILKTFVLFKNNLELMFDKLSPLLIAMAPQHSEVLEFVLSTMTKSIITINEHAISIHLNETVTPKSHLLTLSCIWLHLERELSNHFERRFKALTESVGLTAQFKGFKDWSKKINECIHETTQSILEFYVQSEGEKLSPIICKAISNTDWLNRREPRDVDMIIEMLTVEMKELRGYLVRVFSEESSPLSRSKSNLMPTVGGNLRELFKRFGKVDFDRKSILSAIIKYSFKTFLECIRMVTFGTHGYQQIQVNMTYMKLALIKLQLIDDKSSVILLLDEIVNSAEDRTIEPVAMDELIIERICNDKLRKSKLDLA